MILAILPQFSGLFSWAVGLNQEQHREQVGQQPNLEFNSSWELHALTERAFPWFIQTKLSKWFAVPLMIEGCARESTVFVESISLWLRRGSETNRTLHSKHYSAFDHRSNQIQADVLPWANKNPDIFIFPEPPCYHVLSSYGNTHSIVNPYTLSAVLPGPHNTPIKSSWFCMTRMKMCRRACSKGTTIVLESFWLSDFLFIVVIPKERDCSFLYGIHGMIYNHAYIPHAEASLLITAFDIGTCSRTSLSR